MNDKAWVKANDEWVPVSAVEFVDIEESFHGDIMTFIYEGKKDWSLVVIGSKPG